ncbi:MAG: ribonuclease D [Planctomycetes bacterium]|nr:ribonuclease D [Planctomycetota bacterium]
MSDSDDQVLWVGDAAGLERLLGRLAGAAAVTLDTEFVGDRSYVPRLCLVQIGGPGVVACVDPLAPIDLGPLWALLRDERIVKVLHAAENDLGLLAEPCGGVPGPVFDTQIAAALCGHGASEGYATLCERLLGVVIDKSMQRTDWARRPLSAAAVRYAGDDVRHLRDLHRVLAAELAARGRSDWAAEEFAALTDPARYRVDPRQVWRRIRGHERLSGAELVVLRELAQWRELTARSSNRPRRWILPDDACLAIARRPPHTETDLRSIPAFDVGRHGQYGRAVIAVAAAARRLGGAAELAAQAGSTAAEQAALERLQAATRAVAERLALAPELLATTAELTEAARGRRDGPLFSGWRRAVLGQLAADLLSAAPGVRIDRDAADLDAVDR